MVSHLLSHIEEDLGWFLTLHIPVFNPVDEVSTYGCLHLSTLRDKVNLQSITTICSSWILHASPLVVCCCSWRSLLVLHHEVLVQ